MALWVLEMDSLMASQSTGTRERRSRTSTSMPSAASFSAASMAKLTSRLQEMMVRSLPSRFTLALPMGVMYSSSGIISLWAYSSLCSNTTTGSGSRIAALMRPLASSAQLGATTFRPGKWHTMPSRDWECWPALRRPEPMGIRSTRGMEH